jgi:periplasmic chaperone LolA
MTRCATLVLLLGLVLTPPALGQDAVSLTDVQAAYDALDGLRASFTQVISSEFAGDTTRIEGTVLLSGNKYRVETPTQTVVTDGQTTWIYTPADSQVVVNDAEQDASTVTPKTFLTASADRYEKTASTPATRDGTPHAKLAVAATDSTARFKEATLWVRRADRVVTRMRATDRNGSTLDLRLRDLAVNPSLTDDPFTFTPPEGVEVIDLRQSE